MKNLFFSENRLIGFSQETNPQPKILKPDPFEDKKEKVDGKAETKETAEAPDRSKEINETVTKLGVKLEKMKAMATKMPPELAEKWETFVNARITEINVNANVDQEAAMKAIEKCSQELEKVLSHETASVEVVRNGESVTVTAPSIPGKIPTNFCVVGGIPQSASITADGRQQWTVPSVLPTATATVTYMDCKTGALMQIPIFIGKSGSMKLDAINPAQAKVKTTPMPNAYEEAMPKPKEDEGTPSAYELAMPKAEENVEPAPTKTTEKAPEADKNADIKGAMDQLEFFLGAHEFDDNARSALVRLNAALSARTNPDEKVGALISVGLLKGGVGDDGRTLRTPIMKVIKNPSSNINYEIGTNMNGDSVWVEEVKQQEAPQSKTAKPESVPDNSFEQFRSMRQMTQEAVRMIEKAELDAEVTTDGLYYPRSAKVIERALKTYLAHATEELMARESTDDPRENPRIEELKTGLANNEKRLVALAGKTMPDIFARKDDQNQKPNAPAANAPSGAGANSKNAPKATPASATTPESPAAEPVGPAAKKDLAKKTDALKQDAEKKVDALKEAPGTKGEALERQMDSALKKLGEAKTDTQKFAAFMELLATIIEFIRAAFKGELSQEYNKDGQKGKESKEKEKSKDAYARVAKEVGENTEKKPLTEKLKNLETKKEADLAKTKLDLTKNENDTKTLKEKGVTLGNQKTVLEGELKKIDSKDPKAAEERTRLTAEIQKLTDLIKSNQEAVVASEKRQAELVKKKTELIEDGMVLKEMNEKVGKVLAKLQTGIELMKGKNEFESYELKMSPEGGLIVSFEDPTERFLQSLEKIGGKLNGSAVEIDSEKLASMQALAGKPAGSPNPAERAEDKIEPPKNPDSLDMGEIAKVLKDTFSVLNGKINRTQANLKDAEKDLVEAQATWNPFRMSLVSNEIKAKQSDVDQSKSALAKLNQYKASLASFIDDKGEPKQSLTKEQLENISNVRTKLGLPALPRNMVENYDAFQKEVLEKHKGRDRSIEVDYQKINEMLKASEETLNTIQTWIERADTAAAIGASIVVPVYGAAFYAAIRNAGDVCTGMKTPEQAAFDFALMSVAGATGGLVVGQAAKFGGAAVTKLAPGAQKALSEWAKTHAKTFAGKSATTLVEIGKRATAGAVSGGTFSGVDSGVRNTIAVSKGEKTVEEAMTDTKKSVVSGLKTGAVLGGAFSAGGKAWNARNQAKARRAEATAAKNADPSKAPGFKVQGEAPPPAGSVKTEGPIPSGKPSQARLKAQEKQLVSRLKEDNLNPKEQVQLNNKLFEVRQQLGGSQAPQAPSIARRAGRAYGKARNTVNKGREAVNAFGEKVKEKFRRGEKPAEATVQPKKAGPIARLKENIGARGQKFVNDLKPKPVLNADGVKYQRGETVKTPQGEVVRVRSYNRSTGQMNIEINGRAVSVSPKNYEKIRTNGDIPQKLRDQLKGVEANNAPKAAPKTRQQEIDRLVREEEAMWQKLKGPPPPKAQMEFRAKQTLAREDLMKKHPFSTKLERDFNPLMKKNAPGHEFDLKHDVGNMIDSAQHGSFNGWREQFNMMERGLRGKIGSQDQQSLRNLEADLLKICPPPKASAGPSNTANVPKAKPAAAAQFDETVSLGTAGTLTVKELGTKGLLKVEINGKEAIMSQQEFTRAREQGKLPDRLRNFEKQIAPSAAPALKSKQAEAAEAKPAAAPTALPNQQGTSFTLGNGINLTVAVKNNPPLPLPPGNYQIKSVNPGNGTAIVFRNGSPQDLHTVNLNELNAIPKTQPPPANATSKSPSAPTKLKVPLRLEYRAALTDPSSNIQKTRISMDGYLRTETHPDTLLLKKHLPALKARSTELEKATATPDPKGGVERAGLEMERDFLRSLLPRMEKIIHEKGSSYAA